MSKGIPSDHLFLSRSVGWEIVCESLSITLWRNSHEIWGQLNEGPGHLTFQRECSAIICINMDDQPAWDQLSREKRKTVDRWTSKVDIDLAWAFTVHGHQKLQEFLPIESSKKVFFICETNRASYTLAWSVFRFIEAVELTGSQEVGLLL